MLEKVSIIIPVYKTELYLKQCVDSVLNQTYKDIEVILVDDGSPDQCPLICENYKKEDKRVIVVHKKNGGLSDARNEGIKKSSGKYLTFIDSDDYWSDNDFLANINKQINETEPDVIVFGYNKYYQNNGKMKKSSYMGHRKCVIGASKEEAFNYLLSNNLYISSSCCKLVKRSIITDNQLLFKYGVTSEDIEWSAKIAVFAKDFDYYPHNIYIYRQRIDSITKSIKLENVIDLIDNINKCINFGSEISKIQFYKAYMSYVSYQYITLLAVCTKLNKRERKIIQQDVKNKSFMLRYGENKKIKIVRFIYRMLGFNIMQTLLNIFFRLKVEV